MKPSPRLLPLLIAASLCFQLNAHGQQYYFSTPISGYLTMGVNQGGGPFGGGFQLNYNTLSENVYIDPVNQTIRQVGEISYTPSAPSILIAGYAGPGSTLTIRLAPDSAPVLRFDTGAVPFLFGVIPSGHIWIPTFLGGFSGSYTLLEANGQTSTGSFTYSMGVTTQQMDAYSRVWQNPDYPNSITLDYVGVVLGGEILCFGEFLDFHVGSHVYHGGSSVPNGREAYINYFPPSATATLVPEPSCLVFLSCGLLSLILRRRHQSN